VHRCARGAGRRVLDGAAGGGERAMDSDAGCFDGTEGARAQGQVSPKIGRLCQGQQSTKESETQAGEPDASGRDARIYDLLNFHSSVLMFHVVSFLNVSSHARLACVSRPFHSFFQTNGPKLWQQAFADKWFPKACSGSDDRFAKEVVVGSDLTFLDAYLYLRQWEGFEGEDACTVHRGSVRDLISFSDDSPDEEWSIDDEGFIRYLGDVVDLNRAVILNRVYSLSDSTVVVHQHHDRVQFLRAPCAYYELDVQTSKERPVHEQNVFSCLTIGFASLEADIGHSMPGWGFQRLSFGWHSDDGYLFFGHALRCMRIAIQQEVKFGRGDRVGAGIYPSPNRVDAVNIFFTKNGELVSNTRYMSNIRVKPDAWSKFRPCVGFDSFDKVRFHLESFQFDISAHIDFLSSQGEFSKPPRGAGGDPCCVPPPRGAPT